MKFLSSIRENILFSYLISEDRNQVITDKDHAAGKNEWSYEHRVASIFSN